MLYTIQDFTFVYIFRITLYILPFTWPSNIFYQSTSLHTVSKAFSNSIKAQNSFLLFAIRISKKEKSVNKLSVVEYDFLNPIWFPYRILFLFEKVYCLSFKIAVKSFPRQLRIVIGLQLFGFNGSPMFLKIGYMFQISRRSGIIPESTKSYMFQISRRSGIIPESTKSTFLYKTKQDKYFI